MKKKCPEARWLFLACLVLRTDEIFIHIEPQGVPMRWSMNSVAYEWFAYSDETVGSGCDCIHCGRLNNGPSWFKLIFGHKWAIPGIPDCASYDLKFVALMGGNWMRDRSGSDWIKEAVFCPEFGLILLCGALQRQGDGFWGKQQTFWFRFDNNNCENSNENCHIWGKKWTFLEFKAWMNYFN